ncbi:ATP-binding protein [Larkinella sp. C7]|uniref:sensor histidine kinase n=1 Tax=Larkinella sp. C7 TaxID=2576607 RepID=UPI001110FFB4|nr:PAS domain-containing sensor histidine kinase [Larkinella sp. C7]
MPFNSLKSGSDELDFEYLPGFAQFLLEHHLDELAAEFIRLFREVDLPMLAFYKSLSEDQLLALSVKTTTQLLTAFIENRTVANINATLVRWAQDQLPMIGRNQVATSDMGLISYVRKQALTVFLPRYTTDLSVFIQIIRELDRYAFELQSRMMAQYISLLNTSINEQLHFNAKITDTAPAIIATYNIHTGKYLFVSQGIELLLGYSPRKVLEEGASFLMTILHPDDLPKLVEDNNRALEKANRLSGERAESEQVAEFTYRMRHRNGHYRWFQTYGTIFDRNGEGNVEHVLNISLDITDKVEAERQAQEKNRRLEQSNASLQEFAYIASHDLKEPLRKIMTFGERLLSQATQLSEEGQLYLSKIIDAAQRMHELIGDVLSVSLIASDQTFENQSLQRLLEEVLQSLEYQIEQVNASIESDGLPVATVVAAQFRQVFQNLLTNALKFARKDTPPVIRISHRFLSSNQVSIPGLTKARRYLELKISDNGIGFDNRYATKIFAIFQRLHAKKDFEGTGIGLAICKKIVENHGGIITADSAPDHGATFTIVMPA